MNQLPPYKIFSLGDSALVLDFGNNINESVNEIVHSLFYQLQSKPLPGMVEAIPAYGSLTICYDVLSICKKINGQSTAFEWMGKELKKFLTEERSHFENTGTLISIPVCYEKEFGTDLDRIAEQNEISTEEIIHLHTASIYRVYMLGFLPGFAYMGIVDDRIASPRKLQPETVKAGSVGIAGKQTGIYPLQSPGGWQIIGRTPLQLFDKNNDHPTLFKSGDRVQFYSITKNEFENIKSRIA
jgi:inhibitor of KinA